MTIQEAMRNRHSVRGYTGREIESGIIAELQAEVEACNSESGLNIQLITGEPAVFTGFLAHYGKFAGVNDYFALIGEKSAGLEEKTGYFGEKLVLKAQQLGLNTCWVALTYKKGKSGARIGGDEKMVCVISVGYGTAAGVPHKDKPAESLYRAEGETQDWFRSGMDAVMLAPTARNQQSFLFTLSGDKVKAEATGGFYSKVDLGIVKYHFEIGAGKDNFKWAG
jgi:hypothetical protein